MKHKQNLHTHSTFCDGKDTPREMIETAIKKGFTSLGFSGHSYMPFSPLYSMSMKDTENYINEINTLKKEYEEKIEIFLGIEFEMFSEIDLSPYEYTIGSCHYLLIDGKEVGFDRDAKAVKEVIDTYFDGDGMAYAKEYYKTLATLPERGKFDIIGHFDLITKHCENENFFDVNSKEYISYALEAMEALSGKIPFFEVNTGAISRGYRTTPYPLSNILKELKNFGFKPIISSDCHNAQMLDCYFKESEEFLKSCGFKEKYILTKNGFIPVSLGD